MTALALREKTHQYLGFTEKVENPYLISVLKAIACNKCKNLMKGVRKNLARKL